MSFFKFILRIAFALAIPLVVAVFSYLFLSRAFFRPMNPIDKSLVVVEVGPGQTFAQICKKLRDKGVLRYWWSLSALARMKKMDTKINAGEYEFTPAMTPRDILSKLISGEVIKRQITVKEGQTIWDIGPLVEKAGLMTAEEFNPALTDPDLLARAGLTAPSFEGYLYPETYLFSRPISRDFIIWRMIEEGEKRWESAFSIRADELRMSRHEIITLASIIEKESGNEEELPLVSSVFHNRLAQGMKLQADPTVIYGISGFDGNLTKENLQDMNNPYNTYTHLGLPPGPICNPGLGAIKAALYPAQSNYIFFVSNGTGKHVFSATLSEHNENVEKYQKRRGDAQPAPAAPAQK